MKRFSLFIEIMDLSEFTEVFEDPEGLRTIGYHKTDIFQLIEEEYEIIYDGRLFINPEYRLNSNHPLPSQRTREERYREHDFRYCNDNEIQQIKTIGSIQFCKEHNDSELEKVIAEKQQCEEKHRALPGSKDIQKRISSLNEIIGKFLIWYGTNNIDVSNFFSKISPSSIQISEETKILWKGTKSEFARFIRDNYREGEFKSQKAAVEKYHSLYRFDYKKEWTFEQCYNLFRQTP